MHKMRVRKILIATLCIIAGIFAVVFSVHAQWQEPSASPPQGLPPGFVWLQGATPTVQVGNISINGNATFGPVSFSGDAQGVQVTASSTALRLYSNRDVVIRLNADYASDGADTSGTFFIENGAGDLVYQIGEDGTSEQRSAVDPVTGQPQFFSTAFSGTQQILYQANSNYFTFNPITSDPANAGVYVSGGRVHIATDASSGVVSATGDLILYGSDTTTVREGLRIQGTTGNVQIGTLCLSGVCNSTWPVAGGGGSVTSVGLSLPSPIFAVSGSPVTSSGTLTASWNDQNPNLVLAGPNGAPGAPTFRALVAADIPSIDATKITSGTLADTLLTANVALLNRTPQAFTGANTFGSVGVSGTVAGTMMQSTRAAGGVNAVPTFLVQSNQNVAIQIDDDANDANSAWFQVFGKLNLSSTGGDAIPDLIFGVSEGGELLLQNARGGKVFGITNSSTSPVTTATVAIGPTNVPVSLAYESGTARLKGYGDVYVQLDADASATVNKFAVKGSDGTTDVFTVSETGAATIGSTTVGGTLTVGGSAVLRGRYVIQASAASPPFSFTATASCTSGDVVIGGGCQMSGTGVALRNSFPVSDSAWQCFTEGMPDTLTAYAICAKD